MFDGFEIGIFKLEQRLDVVRVVNDSELYSNNLAYLLLEALRNQNDLQGLHILVQNE